MDLKTRIRAILECNFAGYKDELLDNATDLIYDATITGDKHTIEKTKREIDILLEIRGYVVGKEAEVAINHAINALRIESDLIEHMSNVPENKKPLVCWSSCPNCGAELATGIKEDANG